MGLDLNPANWSPVGVLMVVAIFVVLPALAACTEPTLADWWRRRRGQK